MAKLRITWVKSGISYERSQRRTLTSLGLHRLNQSVVQEDSRPLRGMINKVRHLVKVRKKNRETGHSSPSPRFKTPQKEWGGALAADTVSLRDVVIKGSYHVLEPISARALKAGRTLWSSACPKSVALPIFSKKK